MSDLDAEEMVHFAEIGDWEIFRKLPLKLGNLADGISDEAKIVNMSENDGKISVG